MRRRQIARIVNFRPAMGIERYLHDLLYAHDLVIVPQWGGFLTHYRSARIDEANQLIHPPGKDVSFNRSLDRNDGILADHVARRERKEFRDAQRTVEGTVKEWRRVLEKNGRLELPHIGIFYHDAERNLQFDPDRSSNFLKDAYGLRPLAAVPVQQEVPVIRMAPPLPSAPVTITTEEKKTTIMWAAAATAAVLFGAAALWAYSAGGDRNSLWSGFDPSAPRIERTYQPMADPIEAIPMHREFSLPAGTLGVQELDLEGTGKKLLVDLGTPEPVVAEVAPAVVPAPKSNTNIRSRFHVIGGCFSHPENADRFYQELVTKGFQPVRLPEHKGLHPVAFGSFPDRKTALETLAQVKSTQYPAWLLVR
jgi:hypothetical protein